MTMYPLIKVQQPEPFDIVDQQVRVAGVGTGFEATIGLRVRDGESRELARTFVNAGGTGVLGNFQAVVDLPGGVPSTPDGFVEVFDASGADVPANMVVVPVVFGEHLVPGYFGFSLRTVVAGDTLSGISQEAYGDVSLFLRIFNANRNQLSDPNLIFPGQRLRVPLGSRI
ncbi:MAG TPA: Gmad2 immunoglobulin-like domain-containing protein [Acidimicrobiales bacterium]|nr:Gmad2 immunoglobulin-like domain-containing protein [Acidimicrobiales bacterium]